MIPVYFGQTVSMFRVLKRNIMRMPFNSFMEGRRKCYEDFFLNLKISSSNVTGQFIMCENIY